MLEDRIKDSGRASRISTLWMLNPIVFTVSVRGSCDCIISAMLLLLVKFAREDNWFVSGILYTKYNDVKITRRGWERKTIGN